MAVEDRLPASMRRLCVFTGSSPGAHSGYVLAAEELARALAAQGVGLVYGGAGVGLQSKPLGLLDVRGYYAKLVAFLDHTVAERFVTVEHREMLVVEQRAEALLEAFRRWRPPARPKWIERSQT